MPGFDGQWIPIGTAEFGWEAIRLFRDTRVGKGWVEGADFDYREVPGAEHPELAGHAGSARMGDVLEWMLPLKRNSAHR